jgi:hypothetical protein
MDSVLSSHNAKENQLTEDDVLVPSAVFSEIDREEQGEGRRKLTAVADCDARFASSHFTPKKPEASLDGRMNNQKIVALNNTEGGKYPTNCRRNYSAS